MNSRKKISIFTMLFALAMVFVLPINAKAATKGEKLITPEPGWQRYDDKVGSDGLIMYGGTGSWSNGSYDSSVYYKGTDTYVAMGSQNNRSTHNIKFRFYGTKIRFIGYQSISGCSNCYITIDGVTDQFTQNSSSYAQGALNYEKTGLPAKLHEVEIYSVNTNSSHYGLIFDAIDIDDTGKLVLFTNLTAIPGDTKVALNWDAVPNATSYNIKRSTTPGGPYTKIATGSAITYTDSGLTNGTTYYYVITAVINGKESLESNEASATPTATITGNNAMLELTMTNGVIKEYDLTAAELNDFLTWYDNKSDGTGKSYFVFTKKHSIKPFLNRKEYIAYNKISSFEVNEYTD